MRSSSTAAIRRVAAHHLQRRVKVTSSRRGTRPSGGLRASEAVGEMAARTATPLPTLTAMEPTERCRSCADLLSCAKIPGPGDGADRGALRPRARHERQLEDAFITAWTPASRAASVNWRRTTAVRRRTASRSTSSHPVRFRRDARRHPRQHQPPTRRLPGRGLIASTAAPHHPQPEASPPRARCSRPRHRRPRGRFRIPGLVQAGGSPRPPGFRVDTFRDVTIDEDFPCDSAPEQQPSDQTSRRTARPSLRRSSPSP
jgi:hypothetical protein